MQSIISLEVLTAVAENGFSLNELVCVFALVLWVYTHQPVQGLKKQVVCIFGINVVVSVLCFIHRVC